MSDTARTLRFDSFELDAGAGELRKGGDRIKLPPQPLRVLELLASRSGEVVTRVEIRERIWRDDTFVDFEQGLNFCIRQIREALGDTADTPRFIETLPRRGYRFLFPVETSSAAAPKALQRVIVLPFRMLRPDPATDFLAFSLPDAITSAFSGLKSLVVRSSLAASRFAGGSADPKTIAAEVDVDLIVTGTLLASGDEIRVTAQLTDAASGTLLCSHFTQAHVGNVFQLQDELTDCVLNAMQLRLSAGEEKILRKDVPASDKAYEYYLRGNQFSHDAKQWSAAHDLYRRCLEADPRFAPAWARLGRIQHVISKYLPNGNKDGVLQAEAAFRRALELNPDLAIVHKFYAQLEVEQGRAVDAIRRLVPRVLVAPDPEVFAGLISPLCYCGLLDASAAAHRRAVALEPKIRTSVPHTLFLQHDYVRLAAMKFDDHPYLVALALNELGRKDEALPQLRALEQKVKTRIVDFIIMGRTYLEGDETTSLATADRIVASGFSDPQAFFYLARHFAHLHRADSALELIERCAAGGFFPWQALATDPWFDSLRPNARFSALLETIEHLHRSAAEEFERLEGGRLLEVDRPRP